MAVAGLLDRLLKSLCLFVPITCLKHDAYHLGESFVRTSPPPRPPVSKWPPLCRLLFGVCAAPHSSSLPQTRRRARHEQLAGNTAGPGPSEGFSRAPIGAILGMWREWGSL